MDAIAYEYLVFLDKKKKLYLPRMWLCERVYRSIVIATATGNWNQNVLGLWVMHILWFVFCVVKGLGLMNLLLFIQQ